MSNPETAPSITPPEASPSDEVEVGATAGDFDFNQFLKDAIAEAAENL